jgi:AcrR family transcriptional regulator
MKNTTEQAGGVRERKRQQTLERIAEVSLHLFVANGYEETTLDAIAAAAGIARRTFFYYYKSKDEMLIALQCEGFVKALHQAFVELPMGTTRLDALRKSLPKLVASFENDRTLAIADIMDSTESLRVRKLSIFIEMESALFSAMARAWPASADQAGHRLMATIAVGVLRLSMEQWREDPDASRFAEKVRRNFDLLERVLI